MRYGIVAEYNPFHSGHKYQIEQIRKKDPRAFITVIMSGYFCQRGEPAILSARSRAEMALACGADLILQLPTYAALGSAEIFAETAVLSLAKTGICENLVFGSESDNLENLEKIAQLLIVKQSALWQYIEPLLKDGVSYAKAREQFVAQMLGTEIANLLTKPNQILAIEYLKAIRKHNLQIKPILIKREGANYLAQDLSNKDLTLPSALAIRKLLHNKKKAFFNLEEIKLLKKTMPNKALAILLRDWQNGSYVKESKLNSLCYLMLENTNQAKTRYLDQPLLNRLKKEIRFSNENYPAIDKLVEATTTRQYPKTRIKRALCNMLLNLKDREFEPLYLHVLGFNKDGRYLLKKMKENAKLPVISNFSELQTILEKSEFWQEELELRASRFWLELAEQPINQIFDSPLRIR